MLGLAMRVDRYLTQWGGQGLRRRRHWFWLRHFWFSDCFDRFRFGLFLVGHRGIERLGHRGQASRMVLDRFVAKDLSLQFRQEIGYGADLRPHRWGQVGWPGSARYRRSGRDLVSAGPALRPEP